MPSRSSAADCSSSRPPRSTRCVDVGRAATHGRSACGTDARSPRSARGGGSDPRKRRRGRPTDATAGQAAARRGAAHGTGHGRRRQGQAPRPGPAGTRSRTGANDATMHGHGKPRRRRARGRARSDGKSGRAGGKHGRRSHEAGPTARRTCKTGTAPRSAGHSTKCSRRATRRVAVRAAPAARAARRHASRPASGPRAPGVRHGSRTAAARRPETARRPRTGQRRTRRSTARGGRRDGGWRTAAAGDGDRRAQVDGAARAAVEPGGVAAAKLQSRVAARCRASRSAAAAWREMRVMPSTKSAVRARMRRSSSASGVELLRQRLRSSDSRDQPLGVAQRASAGPRRELRRASRSTAASSSAAGTTRLTSPSRSASAAPKRSPSRTDLHRLAHADDARQRPRAAAVRRQRDLAVGGREIGVVGGDDEIAGVHQRQAEAGDGAVHARDDRMRHPVQMSRSPRAGARSMRAKSCAARSPAGRASARGERADVAAGHEVPAGAAQDDDAQRCRRRRAPRVCATSASIIARSSALSASGRLSVSVATAPSRASRTESFIGRSMASRGRCASAIGRRAVRRRFGSAKRARRARARRPCARRRCARARRSRRSRARTRGSRDRVREYVVTGSRPRASLCTPCAPPSKRAMPRSMQNSIAW